jgi:DNA-binding MarR family transcriptional regulator
MDKILIEFVNTLDLSLKRLQKQVGVSSGFSRLTINQLRYIDAIAALGEPSITEIADQLKITKASVTASINKLIQMGYVTKTQSSEDKRVFHVNLTDASRQLINAKFQALKEYGELIRQALNEDEARQFEKTLTKIVKLFGQSD